MEFWDIIKNIAAENAGLAIALGFLYFIMQNWVKREREMGEDCQGREELLVNTIKANTEALTELKAVIERNGYKEK